MAPEDLEEKIPPKGIELFSSQVPGNKELPLKADAKFSGLQNSLRPVEELPEQVRNVIEDIRAAMSVEEKAAIAHSFSQAYIKDELQFGGKFGEEREVSFEELAADPIGDCDDHQKLTS